MLYNGQNAEEENDADIFGRFGCIAALTRYRKSHTRIAFTAL